MDKKEQAAASGAEGSAGQELAQFQLPQEVTEAILDAVAEKGPQVLAWLLRLAKSRLLVQGSGPNDDADVVEKAAELIGKGCSHRRM